MNPISSEPAGHARRETAIRAEDLHVQRPGDIGNVAFRRVAARRQAGKKFTMTKSACQL